MADGAYGPERPCADFVAGYSLELYIQTEKTVWKKLEQHIVGEALVRETRNGSAKAMRVCTDVPQERGVPRGVQGFLAIKYITCNARYTLVSVEGRVFRMTILY